MPNGTVFLRDPGARGAGAGWREPGANPILPEPDTARTRYCPNPIPIPILVSSDTDTDTGPPDTDTDTDTDTG
eukprot:gene13664-biopygen2711